MPEQTPPPGDGVGTVAVIVVSGVGDDTFGSARDAMVAALRDDPDGRWGAATLAEVTLVAAADTGDNGPEPGELGTGVGAPNLREPFRVPVAEVAGQDGAPTVRVHEMYWADLSRAQGPVQRLFYLLFAITLQVSTIGLEAVRGFPDTEDPAGARTRRWLRSTLSAGSYWLAYVITPLIVALVTLAVIVNLELLTQAEGITSWVLFGVIAAAGIGAEWWIADRIYRGGWTFDRAGEPWAYPTAATPRGSPWAAWTLGGLVAALVGSALWLGIDEQHRDFTVQLTAMLLIVTVAAAVANDAAGAPPGADGEAIRRARRRVRFTIRAAVAAVALGATLLAVLNDPRDGDAGVKTANALTAVALGAFRAAWLVMLLLCLASVTLACRMRFKAGRARDERRRLSVSVMLAIMLGPVMYALASSAIFLVFAALWRIYPEHAKRWPPETPLKCPGDTIVRPTVGGTCRSNSTADWGYRVVEHTVQPLGLALALTGVALVCLGWFFRPYVASFRHRNRYANAVDVSIDQGTAFTRALERAGRDGIYAWVYAPIVALVTMAAAVIWTVDVEVVRDIGDALAGIAVPLAYFIAVLALAGVGLQNIGVAGRLGAGFLTGLGRVLDMTYDIATYLRVANPAIVPPRVQMVGRYRAVLRRIATESVDHVVIMAHSQGTALTLATLLGDPHRSPPVPPVPAAGLPQAPITFLSYGCPAAQTYERRFPRQFTSWVDAPCAPTSIGRWLNVFRAGDFIGRGIVPAASFDPRQVTPQPLGQERCLGPGQHTAYLADERWRRVARHVVASPYPAGLADAPLDDLTVVSRDDPPLTPSAA